MTEIPTVEPEDFMRNQVLDLVRAGQAGRALYSIWDLLEYHEKNNADDKNRLAVLTSTFGRVYYACGGFSRFWTGQFFCCKV